MTFRIGLIGAGTHGTRYLRHAAQDVAGMRPTAIFRRNQEAAQQLAREFECRAHKETGGLIGSPEVDGVIVCTPPASHFPLAKAVLEAGKPLLMEKPLTGTLDQALELAALAGETPVMVAHTLRWNPVIRKARELWPRLGKVHHLRLAQRLEPTTLSWQRNLAETVGGSVLLTGVHIFDLARHLTGREFLTVDNKQDRILNPVVEDFFLARGCLDDGCQVSLEVSKFTRSRACYLEAVGEESQIFADYLHGGLILRQGAAEERFDISARVPTLPMVLAAWMQSVQEGAEAPVTLDDGIATMRLVDACYRSAASGKEVTLMNKATFRKSRCVPAPPAR